MKILTILVLILTFPFCAFGNEPVRGDLPLSTLKRYIDVYLKIDGATPIPADEQAKFLYMCATFQGIISGVELSDAALGPKESILENLDEHDLETVFRDLRDYLSRMRDLSPEANGYNILSYFIMTNYTENASVKLKFAPMIFKEVTKGKPDPAPTAPSRPATKPADGGPANTQSPTSPMRDMSHMKYTKVIDYRHGPKTELVWLALLASPKESVMFQRSGNTKKSVPLPNKKFDDLWERIATIKDFSTHRIDNWSDSTVAEKNHVVTTMKKANIDGKIEEIVIYAIPDEGASREFFEWLRDYKGLLQGEIAPTNQTQGPPPPSD